MRELFYIHIPTIVLLRKTYSVLRFPTKATLQFRRYYVIVSMTTIQIRSELSILPVQTFPVSTHYATCTDSKIRHFIRNKNLGRNCLSFILFPRTVNMWNRLPRVYFFQFSLSFISYTQFIITVLTLLFYFSRSEA